MTNDCFRNNIIGNSPELLNVVNSSRLVAKTDVTVLITGESGTGKELLAQSIHQNSPRTSHPFIIINCAAIPEASAESELFGYVKGAFPGAEDDREGLIAGAHRGTLFFDEISELPLSAQANLLRFLETGEIHPVGQRQALKLEARVIAATHADLYQLVQEGRFREDLYFRLNVVPLKVPSLRERQNDIELITRYYLHSFSQQYDLAKPILGQKALKTLLKYHWPGNIRELRNLCERLSILQPGKEIGLEQLPAEMTHSREPKTSFSFSLPESGIKLFELEKRIIRQALERTNGNRSRAARLLGLSRDTLLYRIKKYTIEA